MHLKIKTWRRMFYLIPCHRTKKATLGFCSKVFFSHHCQWSSCLQLQQFSLCFTCPDKSSTSTAGPPAFVWRQLTGRSVSRPFNPAAVCGAAQRSCVLRTYRPSFMVLPSAQTSAYVPDAEKAAFQVYFGGNPCSVALGFLLRLHQRLRMSSKCCCCQSSVSTLQDKTSQLISKMTWNLLAVKSTHLPTCFCCIVRYGAIAASLLPATLACASYSKTNYR